MDVGNELLVHVAFGGYNDDGHLLIDQGDGAVLHLGGRVAFRVDVADFLQFEGTFKGDGEVVATAQKEGIRGVHHVDGQCFDARIEAKHGFNLCGDGVEFLGDFGTTFGR